jgi:hypothetical protein
MDKPEPTDSERKWAPVYGVRLISPGYIYMIQDHNRFKIGRTVSRSSRLRAAATWLPDAKIIGIKPFWDHRRIEVHLHEGFADSWYDREWFAPYDDDYRNVMVDGFSEFSDQDRFRNSVDFIYWFNSSGMAEFVIERARQNKPLRSFQRQETFAVRPAKPPQ